MHGVPLTELEEEMVWDWIYSELSFKPSVRSIDWPSISARKRYFKFKIDFLFGADYNAQKNENFIRQGIEAFIEITVPGEEIYALNWQHVSYSYDPRKLSIYDMIEDNSSKAKISFIPNGDYYIFLTKDLENIWFGHPWEKTITIIGDKLLNAFKFKGRYSI
jgi:hypothetical protein